MKKQKYPLPIEKLIDALQNIPGVGKKTAERYAFSMISWKEHDLNSLARLLEGLPSKIFRCESCRCIKDSDTCLFCDQELRDTKALCIVASVKDVFQLEETGVYKGLYHVIDHLFSPMEGKMLSQEDLAPILERIKAHSIEEVILAFDSTLEGDATSLFLQEALQEAKVSTTRLALGIPMGSALDYIDEHTLSKAFQGRVRL